MLIIAPALLLAGCEPPAASEDPISSAPGLYAIKLPSFFPSKSIPEKASCIKDGAEKMLAERLIGVPFEAVECKVQPLVRKGNFLTVSGTCTPPSNVAKGMMGVEGQAIVESTAITGSFKLDLSAIEASGSDATKASILTKLTRFRFEARRVGDC